MTIAIADLELPATPARPFTLTLHLGLLTGHLIALVVVKHCVIVSASGDGELAESSAMGPVLKIDGTRFKLLPEEVEIVRDFLARFISPPAPAPSLAAADEAAATDLPLSGSGMTPPPVCTGGGSLDENAV